METKCVFCQIARGEKPAEILYQDQSIIVFKDIHPHAPIHLLIAPKRHIRSLNELTEEDKGLISDMIFRARELAKNREFRGRATRSSLTRNGEADKSYFIFISIFWAAGKNDKTRRVGDKVKRHGESKMGRWGKRRYGDGRFSLNPAT